MLPVPKKFLKIATSVDLPLPESPLMPMTKEAFCFMYRLFPLSAAHQM